MPNKIAQVIGTALLVGLALFVIGPPLPFGLGDGDSTASQTNACMKYGNLEAIRSRPSVPGKSWAATELAPNYARTSRPQAIPPSKAELRPGAGTNTMAWSVDEGVVACQIKADFDPGSVPGATLKTRYANIPPGMTASTYDPPKETGYLVTFTLLAYDPKLPRGRGDLSKR